MGSINIKNVWYLVKNQSECENKKWRNEEDDNSFSETEIKIERAEDCEHNFEGDTGDKEQCEDLGEDENCETEKSKSRSAESAESYGEEDILLEHVNKEHVNKCTDEEEVKALKKAKPRTSWIFLTDIEISQEYMKLIFLAESKTIDKKMFTRYKNLIAKNHIDPIVGCIALIKTFHVGSKKVYSGNEELTFWIYCQHESCNRKFKMSCELDRAENGKFRLFRSDHDQTHEKFLTRQVRQVEREQFAEQLLDIMPMEFRRRNIEKATDELLEQKNLQDVKSDAVNSKLRHEALKNNDLNVDVMKDLEMMMDGERGFVQRIIKIPFAVYIFSKQQCSVIAKLFKDSPTNERVGHLDATGGVVRHPFPNDDSAKQIYYYACIMNLKIKNDPIGTLIPIFELVSDCQNAEFLAAWVFSFKIFVRAHYPQVRTPFQRIVVDKSYALIHAVLEGFNNLSLREYLDRMYEVVLGKLGVDSTTFKNLVKIHLCYTHLSKVFSKNILKAFQLKKHNAESRFLKEALQFIAKSKNFNEIKSAFYHLATMLVNEFHNESVENSHKALQKLMEDQHNKNLDNDEIKNTDTDESELDSTEYDNQLENIEIDDTIYNNSPFYHEFNIVLQERCKSHVPSANIRQNLLKSNTKRNAFYNIGFIHTFSKNYLSILPMWSGLVITDSSITVYHNQHVESNFRISKECFKRKPVQLGKLPTKCGRYLRENIKRTERDIKAFKWDIGKFRLASNKPRTVAKIRNNKRKRNDECDYAALADAQEKWMKKRPKTSHKNTNRNTAEVRVDDVKTEQKNPFILEALHFFEYSTDKVEHGRVENHPKPMQQTAIDVTKRLENGLVDDPRFYKNISKFNYVVTLHEKNRLMSEDFNVLSGKEWLSNTAVEYLLQVLLRDAKNIQGTCLHAPYVFLEPPLINSFKSFQKNYVLLPLVEDNHFVLFILDIAEKNLYYLDPKGETQNKFQKYTQNFNSFLAAYNSKFKSIGDIDQWRVKKFEHCLQSDSVNCGVYVVRFCELFVTKGEVHYEEFDPYEYRSELKNLILRTSFNMVDICLRCGQNDAQTPKGVEWIGCDSCNRWLHSSTCANVNCMDYPEGVEYICPLCKTI